MSEEQELTSLIGEIYDAATDEARRPRLCSLVAQWFATDSCFFHFCQLSPDHKLGIPPTARPPFGTPNFDPSACSAYAAHYHQHNEWYARGWTKGFPAIVLGEELIETKALMRTEWFDFCRSTEIYHLIGAQTLVDDGFISAVGVHRPERCKSFDESDRRKMSLILPHIQRSQQIAGKLGAAVRQGGLAFELLETLSVGVAIVAADGRLLYANRVAEKVFRTSGGLCVVRGRLRPQAAGDGAAFERSVSDMVRTGSGTGTRSGGMMHLRRSDMMTMPVLIAPLRVAGHDTTLPSAAVIFADPDAATVSPWRMLAWRWGLTPAEARLLAALAAGQEVGSYANATGVGVGTVRTHLKQIFAKTGYRRQVDLVRAVLSDPLMRLEALVHDDGNP